LPAAAAVEIPLAAYLERILCIHQRKRRVHMQKGILCTRITPQRFIEIFKNRLSHLHK
jgi:hypothetical protein